MVESRCLYLTRPQPALSESSLSTTTLSAVNTRWLRGGGGVGGGGGGHRMLSSYVVRQYTHEVEIETHNFWQ